jgi:uncharacterized protein DUF417
LKAAPCKTRERREGRAVRLHFGQNTYNLKKRVQMTTNQIRLQVAERSVGSLSLLALLRWALVIIFLWFGGMKFTAYEAAGIAPFIDSEFKGQVA